MKQVTTAILQHDGKILIARRPWGDKLSGKWEFPGGTIEDGETPERCLKRELQEEFGIDVEVDQFFASSMYEYGHEAIELYGYWVTWTDGDLQPTAHSEIAWVTPAETSNYDFAPADIPLAFKLRAEYPGGL